MTAITNRSVFDSRGCPVCGEQHDVRDVADVLAEEHAQRHMQAGSARTEGDDAR